MEYASRNSRGFEPESADAIYQYANGRFDYGIREERKRRIPSALDGFFWSLGDSNSVKSWSKKQFTRGTASKPVHFGTRMNHLHTQFGTCPLLPETVQYPLSYPASYDKLLEITCPRPLNSSKVAH